MTTLGFNKGLTKALQELGILSSWERDKKKTGEELKEPLEHRQLKLNLVTAVKQRKPGWRRKLARVLRVPPTHTAVEFSSLTLVLETLVYILATLDRN